MFITKNSIEKVQERFHLQNKVTEVQIELKRNDPFGKLSFQFVYLLENRFNLLN